MRALRVGTRGIALALAQARWVVDRLLAENEGRWESLSAADRERVELLARTAVNRLLHEPTLRVRQLDTEHRHARLQLLRELFGLDEPAAAERPAGGEVRPLRQRDGR